jgi:hypothetical protein
MSGHFDAARSHYGTADSRVRDTLGVGLTPIIIAVVVLVIAVLVWYFQKDMLANHTTPIKHGISTGTPNHITGGNMPLAHLGGLAAGGLFDNGQDTQVPPSHWLTGGPSSGMSVSNAAQGRAVSNLMDVGGGPTIAQVAKTCPPPSWAALEDMRSATMIGSVDPSSL